MNKINKHYFAWLREITPIVYDNSKSIYEVLSEIIPILLEIKDNQNDFSTEMDNHYNNLQTKKQELIIKMKNFRSLFTDNLNLYRELYNNNKKDIKDTIEDIISRYLVKYQEKLNTLKTTYDDKTKDILDSIQNVILEYTRYYNEKTSDFDSYLTNSEQYFITLAETTISNLEKALKNINDTTSQEYQNKVNEKMNFETIQTRIRDYVNEEFTNILNKISNYNVNEKLVENDFLFGAYLVRLIVTNYNKANIGNILPYRSVYVPSRPAVKDENTYFEDYKYPAVNDLYATGMTSNLYNDIPITLSSSYSSDFYSEGRVTDITLEEDKFSSVTKTIIGEENFTAYLGIANGYNFIISVTSSKSLTDEQYDIYFDLYSYNETEFLKNNYKTTTVTSVPEYSLKEQGQLVTYDKVNDRYILCLPIISDNIAKKWGIFTLNSGRNEEPIKIQDIFYEPRFIIAQDDHFGYAEFSQTMLNSIRFTITRYTNLATPSNIMDIRYIKGDTCYCNYMGNGIYVIKGSGTDSLYYKGCLYSSTSSINNALKIGNLLTLNNYTSNNEIPYIYNLKLNLLSYGTTYPIDTVFTTDNKTNYIKCYWEQINLWNNEPTYSYIPQAIQLPYGYMTSLDNDYKAIYINPANGGYYNTFSLRKFIKNLDINIKDYRVVIDNTTNKVYWVLNKNLVANNEIVAPSFYEWKIKSFYEPLINYINTDIDTKMKLRCANLPHDNDSDTNVTWDRTKKCFHVKATRFTELINLSKDLENFITYNNNIYDNFMINFKENYVYYFNFSKYPLIDKWAYLLNLTSGGGVITNFTQNSYWIMNSKNKNSISRPMLKLAVSLQPNGSQEPLDLDVGFDITECEIMIDALPFYMQFFDNENFTLTYDSTLGEYTLNAIQTNSDEDIRLINYIQEIPYLEEGKQYEVIIQSVTNPPNNEYLQCNENKVLLPSADETANVSFTYDGSLYFYFNGNVNPAFINYKFKFLEFKKYEEPVLNKWQREYNDIIENYPDVEVHGFHLTDHKDNHFLVNATDITTDLFTNSIVDLYNFFIFQEKYLYIKYTLEWTACSNATLYFYTQRPEMGVSNHPVELNALGNKISDYFLVKVPTDPNNSNFAINIGKTNANRPINITDLKITIEFLEEL